jgi:beta-galactosidase
VSRRVLLKSALGAAAGAVVLPSPLGAAIRELAAAESADPADEPDLEVAPADSPRDRLRFDGNWRFHLGHAADPSRDFGFGRGRMYAKAGDLFGPSSEKFDDSEWQAVALPHDWAVELPFHDAPELIEFGAKPLGRAYPETSIGWYRKRFQIPASDSGRRIALEFDGVYRDAVVALNGHWLGENLSGYAPFRFDVTDLVNYGGDNVVVVRVDATGREGWFYEGAGIYRHTWLVKTSPVHVEQWGTLVSSRLVGAGAEVKVVCEVRNDSDSPVSARVAHTLRDAAGKLVASTAPEILRIAPWETAAHSTSARVHAPALWSPDAPSLYTATTDVVVRGRLTDRYVTTFGIRSMEWSAEGGFLLNGARVELRGTCNHQDHAGIGTALPDGVQEYRIERLKALGSNAYRTSHNPPTPELLDACDRLGMLVLDETRMFSSQREGISQLERMVRRDRNHPCVFAWSIANEEWNDQGEDRGRRVAASMKRVVRALDPTRPVTAAMDGGWGSGISLVVDVQGCNYERPARASSNLDAFHAAHPHKPVFGTEVASTLCTRGVYANDPALGYMSAYDVNKPGWGATAEEWWTRFDARQWLGGGFVWTGFDYRGEPTPYTWPCITSHFGIMDTCGFPKDNFYYYKAWWGDPRVHVLHLFPHWNWSGREGELVDVWIHSNLPRVELFLNDRSLGERRIARGGHASWSVPYAPGRLVARGYPDGGAGVAAETVRETTGPAAAILLEPDRATIAGDGDDVSLVTVQVVDAAGRTVPTANATITFAVSGAGRLIGLGNGDPSSHEADKGSMRSVFNGLAQAIVQSDGRPGELRLDASSPGLASGSVVVTCAPAAPRPSA